MQVKTELFDGSSALAAIAEPGLDRKYQPHLFDRLEWVRRIAALCPPAGQPLIVRASSDTSATWLFLAAEGKRAGSYTIWYSLAFRPLYTGDPTAAEKKAQLTHIARVLKKRLAIIELYPVPDTDGTASQLMEAFRTAGWSAKLHPKTGSWTISVEGMDFATYWAARPGQVRSTHDRKLKKFGVQVQLHNSFSAKAWAAYESIYGDSWKGQEGSPAFLRAMAETEGAAGCLRLGIATHDGQAVAAQLWTVENGRAIIHKLAYREDVAHLSAGTILTAALFRHVIDKDHVSIIDYGTGDDRYKADWMDQRDQLWTVELVNPRSVAGLISLLKSRISGIVRKRG
jgi:hypothetical protein